MKKGHSLELLTRSQTRSLREPCIYGLCDIEGIILGPMSEIDPMKFPCGSSTLCTPAGAHFLPLPRQGTPVRTHQVDASVLANAEVFLDKNHRGCLSVGNPVVRRKPGQQSPESERASRSHGVAGFEKGRRFAARDLSGVSALGASQALQYRPQGPGNLGGSRPHV